MTTILEDLESKTDADAYKMTLNIQVIGQMAKVYSNYCNKAPVRGMFGREPSQSVRVGSDMYVVAVGKHPETKVAGVQMTVKRNAYGSSDAVNRQDQWFIPFEDLHEVVVAFDNLLRIR